MKAVFTCLLDQVSQDNLQIFIVSSISSYYIPFVQVGQYIKEGLDRARDSLTEAAALREKFVLGTSVISRRVAAAAASAVKTQLHPILDLTVN